LKNSKGFALVVLLSLVPALSAGILLVFSILTIFEKDLELKHTCRLLGIDGQKKVSTQIRNLFKLNPQALRLKLIEAQALQQLALNPNPAVKLASAAKLKKVRAQQEILDTRQKQILNYGNLIMTSNFIKTQTALRNATVDKVSPLIHFDLISLSGTSPRMAVRTNMDGLAPTYTTQPNFNEAQALVHFWQYQLSVTSPFSKFLNGKFKISRSCSVTLKEEGDTWIPQIGAAKSLWKSAW
jgi:hypothetical protein